MKTNKVDELKFNFCREHNIKLSIRHSFDNIYFLIK